MAEDMNKLTAHVGFDVDTKVGSLDKIVEQIKKINETSKNMGKAFDSFEKAFKQLETLTIDSNGKIVGSFSKTKTQINEESKQITAKAKADSQERISIAKAEEAKKVSLAKSKNDTIEANNKKSLETLKANNKVYDKYFTEEEKRKTLVLKSELKQQEIQSRRVLNEKKQDAKEYTDFWKNELNQQDLANKEYYSSLIQRAKNAYSQASSAVRGLSGITNLNSTIDGANKRNQFGYAVANATLTVTGIRAVLNEFANVSSQVVEVEKNVINVQRIMGDTSKEVTDSITQSAFDIAKSTNTQVTDVQDIQNAWVRINDEYAKDIGLLNKITDATAKLVNVGQIQDAEEAVKLLNSAVLQYNMFTADGKVNIDEAIETLDKWAYMADKTAMGTADEFGQSASKIGGFITAIGGNMDDTIVMTAILGDRLAKTGDEAGTALKTIMSYLTRAKTIGLFEKLGLDSDGLSQSLMKTNTQFEEFDVIMSKVSKAYNEAIDSGNDVQAKAIQNAIGAVRQGDSSIALLKNWAEDSKKYYAMVDEASGGSGYLNEQNAKLMEAFSAQWNELRNSMVEFGLAIGKSGLMDGLGSLMGGFSDLLDFISKLDPAILSTITQFTGLLVAIEGIKKLSQYSGIYDTFTTAMKYGTVAQRKSAEELAIYTDNVLKNELAIKRNKTAQKAYINGTKESKAVIDAEINAYVKKATQFEILTAQYKAGSITAKQYIATVKTLDIIEKTENATQAQSIVLEETDIATKKAGKVATIGMTVVTTAQGIAQKIWNGITVTSIALLKGLLSPVNLITMGIMLLIPLISNLKSKTEKYNETLETLKQEYQDLQEDIDTAYEKFENVGKQIDILNAKDSLTLIEQEELTKLKDTNTELSTTIALLQEKQRLSNEEQSDIVKENYNSYMKADEYSILHSRTTHAGGQDITSQDIISRKEYIEELMTEYERLSQINPLIISNEDKAKMDSYYSKLVDYGTQINQYVEDYGVDDSTSQEWKKLADSIGLYAVAQVNAQEATKDNKDAQQELTNIFKENADAVDAYRASMNEINDALSKDLGASEITVLMQKYSTFDWAKYGVDGRKGVGNLTGALNALGLELQNILFQTTEYNGALAEIYKESITASIGTDDLALVTDASNKKTKLSSEQVEYLTQKYSGLNGLLVKVENGWYLEETAIGKVNTAITTLKNSYITAQSEMTQMIADESYKRLQALGIELTGVSSVGQIYGMLMGKTSNASELNLLTQFAEKWFNLQDSFKAIFDEPPKEKDVPTSATDSVDQNRVDFDNVYKVKKHKVAMGEMTEASFADWLDGKQGYKHYFSPTAKNEDGSLKYQEDIFKFEEEVWNIRNKKSKEFSENIDWASTSIANLQETVSDAQNKLSNTDGYEAQVKAINNVITAQKALRYGYRNSATSYQNQYNAITGIDDYKAKIESGKTFSTETITDEALRNKIEQAVTLFNNWQTALDNVEQTTQDINDNYDAIDDALKSVGSTLSDLKSQLVDALKQQYQEQYDGRVKQLKDEAELNTEFHNNRIKQLKAEIDELEGNRKIDKLSKLSTLKTQYNAWLLDDSTLGKAKQKDLSDQIKALDKEIKIDDIEKLIESEQETVQGIGDSLDDLLDETSDTFDTKLSELKRKMEIQNVTAEAIKMILDGNETSIISLLSKYGSEEYYNNIGLVMGKTAGQLIAEAVRLALSNAGFLPVSTYSPPSNGDGKNNDAEKFLGGSTASEILKRMQRYKVPTDTTTGSRSGSPLMFDTGGYTGDNNGLAYLHKKERVLDERQTNAFDYLAYRFLPKIDSPVFNNSDKVMNNNTVFNKELVSVKIDKVVNNTPFDVQNNNDNLSRLFKKGLKESGVNTKL